MKETNLFVAGLSVLLALISFGAQAQNSIENGPKEVMYDPLFWKDELSLRNAQSRKIEEINTEFYEHLRLLKDENAKQPEMERQLEAGLQVRSRKIFDTLLPKQRRKLEKIIDQTAPASAP